MNTLTQQLERIVSGPLEPDREFVVSECSYLALYAMAEQIRTAFPKGEKNILVRTENKAIIAAAVLASLVSDFSIVLPCALSNRALEDIRKSVSIDGVIGDGRKSELPGVFSLDPGACHSSPLSAPLSKKADEPFLKFFTGGSTGKPKIWTKTFENVFGEAFHLSEKFGFSENDRVFCTAPPYHIYGFLFSVLTPFVSSCGVLAKACSFPEEIRQCLRNDSPTVFAAVPMHYRILRDGEIPCDTLRLACCSAGRLEEADGQYYREKTGVELIEIYGSTETGGIAARNRAAGEEYLTPFKVVDWKIENERLHVRSPFLSPDIGKDGEGFYRTGDRAERIDRFRFELLGRADGVAKVGGKRVDLEELREKIKGLSGVADAAVFPLPGRDGRQTDICAVVETRMDKKTLKSSLSKSLEPYAMPRRIAVVEKIPVSSSGKYDRSTMETLLGKHHI